MISKIERTVKPIVIVSADALAEATAIARLAQDDNYELDIEVELRNGDSLHPVSVEEILEIPDKRSNPIEKIRLTCGRYGKKYIDLSLGGSWLDGYGAKLKAQGEPQFTELCAGRFERAFGKEKPICDWIPSTHPLIIVFALLLTVTYVVQGPGGIVDLFEGLSPFEVLFLAFAVSLAVAGIFFVPATLVHARLFGKAAFSWGEGGVRYEKVRTITNYLFWILPVTVILNSLTIFKI